MGMVEVVKLVVVGHCCRQFRLAPSYAPGMHLSQLVLHALQIPVVSCWMLFDRVPV